MSRSEPVDYVSQVRPAMAAVKIHSRTGFSWFGRRMEEPEPGVRRQLSDEAARQWLRFFIQARLYKDFYCMGRAAPMVEGRAAASPESRSAFTAELSAANRGSGFWSSGWTVTGTRNGGVEATKDGLSLYLPAALMRPIGGAAEPGSQVQARSPKELLTASPGFYMGMGDRELIAGTGDRLLRTYWRMHSHSAVRFVEEVTSRLNREGLAFRLKVVSDPGEFDRRDAVVLYFLGSAWQGARMLLTELHRDLAAGLREGSPALTRRVAPGVSLAEDPGHGESFGMHRCGLMADALLLCFERGINNPEAKVQALREVMGEEGLALESPYLSAGSNTQYKDLPDAGRPAMPGPREPHPVAAAELAARIGGKLAQDALWHDGRCNWIGASGATDGETQRRAIYASLGTDLYAGTSGVALFLSELYGLAHEPELKRTACGALRQAVCRAETIAPEGRIGLFSGWTGVAYALARAAQLLGEDCLLDSANQLLAGLRRVSEVHMEPDLIAGRAGGIIGLLMLEAGGVAGLRELAINLGEQLLREAVKSDEGWSWTSPRHPQRTNLTGMSHGAAGISHTLLELFATTGEVRFRDAAAEGFRYEKSHFNTKLGNWPDFREDLRNGRRRKPAYQSAWCHGAPGICLSRVRAWEITGEEQYLIEAQTALSTTAHAIRSCLESGTGSYCLCHGLAGNAEIMRAASSEQCLVEEVAGEGAHRYGRLLDFPSGAPGYTPGLMAGLAGTGYFYLGLAKRLPPILALTPRSYPRSTFTVT